MTSTTGLDYGRAAVITLAAGLDWDTHVYPIPKPGPYTGTRILAVQGLQVLVAFLGEASRQCPNPDEYEDLFGDAVLDTDTGGLHVVFFPSCQLIDF